MPHDPRGDDLAAPTAQEVAWLRVLSDASDARAGLLSVHERRRLKAQVERHHEAEQSYLAWERSVREAQERVDASPESAGPPSRQLKSLWAAKRNAPSNPADQRKAADEARDVLAKDDERRRPHERLLREALDAEAHLRSSLEGRIRAHLASGRTSPWLRVALGELPPRGSVAEAWLVACVDLLMFRFKHSVTDQVLPCGPTGGLPASAAAEASRLLADCDQIRR